MAYSCLGLGHDGSGCETLAKPIAPLFCQFYYYCCSHATQPPTIIIVVALLLLQMGDEGIRQDADTRMSALLKSPRRLWQRRRGFAGWIGLVGNMSRRLDLLPSQAAPTSGVYSVRGRGV